VEIYEGDIVYTPQEEFIKKWVVIFDEGKFDLFNGINSNLNFNTISMTVVDNEYVYDFVVIGNIHDNPERLKEEEK
jgi:hypothetical protein